MRIRIILGVLNKGGVIPFFHQPQIHEIIYCLMASTEYKEFKGYSFSNLKGGTKVTSDGLEITSIKATIIVSSHNSGFINSLKSQLQVNNSFTIGSLNLLVLTIEEEPVINNWKFSTKYICLSQILVNDTWKSNNEYIDPFSDTFSDYLYESTMQKLEEFKVVEEKKLVSLNKFQIVPDKDYLYKFINDPNKFSKIQYLNYDNSIIKIRTYSFPFTLYADPEVQRFVYNSGIGELNHFGLGMLDVIKD